MAFTVVELDESVTPVLGDQSTDRYDLDLFRIPAYKAAFKRLLALIYPFVANRKNSEEIIQELQYTRIFQTNALGGVPFIMPYLVTQMGHDVWTIMGVYAQPNTNADTQPVYNPSSPPERAWWVKDRTWVPGGKPVKRMTMEQQAVAYNNESMAGSEAAANSPWTDDAYYLIGNRRSDDNGWLTTGWELQMTPASRYNKKYIGVTYLKVPTEPTTINSTIELPRSMMVLMRDLALNELSVRQGNRTTLYQVTSQQVGELLMAQT